MWLGLLLSAACLTVALCTSASGIRRFLRERRLARVGLSAAGTVVGKSRKLSMWSVGDTAFHATVRFRDQRGQPVESDREVSLPFARSLGVGDLVGIRHDPADPREFVFSDDRLAVTCYATHILVALIATTVVILLARLLLGRLG